MPDVLTERHLEVLRLAAAGLNNAQIGRRLHVQEDTVKSHLRHVYQRLGVTGGRAHAVAVAYQRGLLPMPPGSTPRIAVKGTAHQYVRFEAPTTVVPR